MVSNNEANSDIRYVLHMRNATVNYTSTYIENYTSTYIENYTSTCIENCTNTYINETKTLYHPYELKEQYPDSKVHGANMGSIWGRQDPGGSHVGPMNFAFRVVKE